MPIKGSRKVDQPQTLLATPTQLHGSQQQQENLGLVLQSIREVISCCACFNSDFGMKECANGHLLCHTCFLTLRQDEHPQCPTCRAVLYPDTKKALIAQKVLSEMPDPCAACGQMMLFKDLTGHKLNECPKRRVACGLAPLGCMWCGSADEYRDHYVECEMKRSLRERPLEENLDNVLARFRRREQALRETFTCFSAVFRHLEGFELNSVSVALSLAREELGRLLFKSDQFHGSQSRWTLELVVTFEEPMAIHEEQLVVEEAVTPTDEVVQPPADDVNSTAQVNSSHSPSDSTETSQERIAPVLPTRQRRGFRFNGTSRSRPYPEWHRNPRNLNNNNNNVITTGSSSTSIDTDDNSSPCCNNQTQQFGALTFTMTKENSPGIGRKSYSFIPLQIESTDTGAQVSFRPRVSSHRFISRGERTAAFNMGPLRWRYLTHLSELKQCRLLTLEMAVARRLVDDQADQF